MSRGVDGHMIRKLDFKRSSEYGIVSMLERRIYDLSDKHRVFYNRHVVLKVNLICL